MSFSDPPEWQHTELKKETNLGQNGTRSFFLLYRTRIRKGTGVGNV